MVWAGTHGAVTSPSVANNTCFSYLAAGVLTGLHQNVALKCRRGSAGPTDVLTGFWVRPEGLLGPLMGPPVRRGGQSAARRPLGRQKVGQAGEQRHGGRVSESEEEETNKEEKFNYTHTHTHSCLSVCVCVGLCRLFEARV